MTMKRHYEGCSSRECTDWHITDWKHHLVISWIPPLCWSQHSLCKRCINNKLYQSKCSESRSLVIYVESCTQAVYCNVWLFWQVFASTEVKYAGQALGLVVATSYSAAQAAAALVVVQYSDVQTPVLTIQQAQTEGWIYPARQEPLTMGDVTGECRQCNVLKFVPSCHMYTIFLSHVLWAENETD